ncbi:MAG: type II toxin-antitoxin system VapC family toxin [Thermoguttaceae bacterium]|jgi:predicted nucleic acid-binding protein
MIHGVDTGFLVSTELVEHPNHVTARVILSERLGGGDRVALAPQVLAEFIHVVTDSRRFRQPMELTAARGIARKWWTAREVDHVFPNAEATIQFLDWLDHLQLGRKRLLDTLLAATYRHGGIGSILTTNPDDFIAFGCFSLITPNGTIAKP